MTLFYQFFQKFLEQLYYETYVPVPEFLLENVDKETRQFVQGNRFTKAGKVSTVETDSFPFLKISITIKHMDLIIWSKRPLVKSLLNTAGN